MTGKVWSLSEERYFWRRIVARSPKRAGVDRINEEKSWDELAVDMHQEMLRRGNVRREYSASVLSEHYFRNVEGDRRSPHAAPFIDEYLRKLGSTRRIINPRSAPRSRRPFRHRVLVETHAPAASPPPPSPVGLETASLQGDSVSSSEYGPIRTRRSQSSPCILYSSSLRQSVPTQCPAPILEPPAFGDVSYSEFSRSSKEATPSNYETGKQPIPAPQFVPSPALDPLLTLLAAAEYIEARSAEASTPGYQAESDPTTQAPFSFTPSQCQDVFSNKPTGGIVDGNRSPVYEINGSTLVGFPPTPSTVDIYIDDYTSQSVSGSPAKNLRELQENFAPSPSTPRDGLIHEQFLIYDDDQSHETYQGYGEARGGHPGGDQSTLVSTRGQGTSAGQDNGNFGDEGEIYRSVFSAEERIALQAILALEAFEETDRAGYDGQDY